MGVIGTTRRAPVVVSGINLRGTDVVDSKATVLKKSSSGNTHCGRCGENINPVSVAGDCRVGDGDVTAVYPNATREVLREGAPYNVHRATREKTRPPVGD